MLDRETASLYFYQTLQTVTDMFDFVKNATHDYDTEIAKVATEMESLADRTLEIAASDDWDKAIRESGIRECWDECQRMFEEEFADYFKRG